MRKDPPMRKHIISLFMKVHLVCLCLLLAGCLPGNKPPQLIEQYTLEYAPPAAHTGTAFADAIGVARFSVAQAYNSTSMFYKPLPYKLAVYNLNRWRSNPGDMMSDFLLRDLGSSGMFLAVFSSRDAENARFMLVGGVEEFLEIDDQSTGSALLTMSVALIDTKQEGAAKRLVFQRRYSSLEPLTGQTPVALARGMSTASRRLSEQILKDISESVRRLDR